MNLTARRLEFLRVLSDLSSAVGGQVHYEAVAARLKVSKWTAYDMMQELMSDGLVRSSYSTASSGFHGRSQVLFEPTPDGLQILGDAGGPSGARDSDYSRREAMLSTLDRVRAALRSGSDPGDILTDLDDRSPLSFCAGMLAVLIVEFKRRGLSLVAVEPLLDLGPEAGSVLPLLIGVLTGELVVKGALPMISNLNERLGRFAREFSLMEEHAKGMLMDFARTVIEVGATG